MRIAITGFSGYLGSALIKNLSQKEDITLVGYDSLVFKHLVPNSLKLNNVNIFIGDISDKQALISAFLGCDVVVHLAALVGDKYCDMYPDIAKKVNVEGTRNVMEAAIRSNIKRMIFSSTCSVYGASNTNKKELLTENSPLNPVSLYAETKISAEEEIQTLCNENDISVTILRLATVFGLSPFTRFDLLINSIASSIANILPIELYGIESYRPYISVVNVIDIILHIIENPEKYRGFQILNAGFTKNNFTKRELKTLILDRYPKTEIIFGAHGNDPRNYCVDFSVLESKLMDTINVVHPLKGLTEVVEAISSGIICQNFVKTDRANRGHY
jgi:nucleoside-diphosphate-sugar epimerase